MERKKVFIILTILTAVFIFYMSSLAYNEIPGQKIRQQIKILPTIYHFTIFFLLAIFMLIGINSKSKIPLAMLICFTYAILDELHQFFTPGRYLSIFDIIIDFLGIICAGIFYVLIKCYQPHQDSIL